MAAIAVLGGGAWGTALASVLASDGTPVALWMRSAEAAETVGRERRNEAYLSGAVLPDTLETTSDLAVVHDARTVLCVTPTQSFAGVMEALAPHLAIDARLVMCAKGIDRASGMFPHQIAARHIGDDRVSVLSGPSFAHDVAAGLPTAVTLAARDAAVAAGMAASLSRPTFRIYSSADMIGASAGGALKNVLAIAVGVARGLGLGASAEAALVARGFSEMERVALALGAKRGTLAGLSGLGDLVLTCSSPQSRNFAYGMALGAGEDLTGRPLAEGVATASIAAGIARERGIDAPLIAAVAAVLAGDLPPADAVRGLLDRPLRAE